MAEHIKSSGRHAGSVIKAIKGRPKIPMIDRIATQAWFNALMKASESKNAYEVAKQYDPSLESKRFEKYARGAVRPTAGTLAAVDRKLNEDFGVKVRSVFDDGPEGVQLWDAMSGNFELLWDIIYKVKPTLKYMRVTHEQKVHEFIDSIFTASEDEPDVNVATVTNAQSTPSNKELYELGEATSNLIRRYLDELSGLELKRDCLFTEHISMLTSASADVEILIEEEGRRKDRLRQELERHSAFMDGIRKHPNTLKAEWKRYFKIRLRSESGINFTFQQLASTIALWRISVLVSDGVNRLDALMTVLIDEAIPEMLEPYGVGDKVVEVLENMQEAYHRSLHP